VLVSYEIINYSPFSYTSTGGSIMEASTPSLREILAAGWDVGKKLVLDRAHLEVLVKAAKASGFKIVLTQGVYDMFHIGHARYLADAASFGEILIVGVDSDELTKAMKGPSRPFDTLDERVELLAMLSFVNIITPLGEEERGERRFDLLKLVHPDVLVVSKSTRSITAEGMKERKKYCGRIESLEAKAATSTTAKLRRLMNSGAQSLAEALAQKVETFNTEMAEIVKQHLEGGGDGS
jgi:D-beta-D-heptose 7-phosphate kinase / D-beta-D-heptose 1-phosphate adenosyltransferase